VHNIVVIDCSANNNILAKFEHRNDEGKLLIHGIPIYATKIWKNIIWYILNENYIRKNSINKNTLEDNLNERKLIFLSIFSFGRDLLV
jgi:hypothetical protein